MFAREREWAPSYLRMIPIPYREKRGLFSTIGSFKSYESAGNVQPLRGE